MAVNEQAGRQYESGDQCPYCSIGRLEYAEVENCSCHINPPCSACTDAELRCDYCERYEDEL